MIDVLWLSTVATDLYDEQLGALRGESPNVLAAVLVYLVRWRGSSTSSSTRPSRPGRGAGPSGSARSRLVVYGVYELDQPGGHRRLAGHAGADRQAWETFLSAAVGARTYASSQRLPAWAR